MKFSLKRYFSSVKGEKYSRLRDIVYDELKNFNAPDMKNGFESATGKDIHFIPQ